MGTGAHILGATAPRYPAELLTLASAWLWSRSRTAAGRCGPGDGWATLVSEGEGLDVGGRGERAQSLPSARSPGVEGQVRCVGAPLRVRC